MSTSDSKVSANAAEVARTLQSENPGYTCRVLDDGSVACVFDLMFTRAIILGATPDSYARRFCFDDRGLAEQRFLALISADDEPAGFIARR